MDVELHVTRVPYAACGVAYSLLLVLVWLSPLPAPLKAAACAALVFSAWSCLRGRSGGADAIQALRLEPLGRLSVIVGRRDGGGPRRLLGVRAFSAPRLLRRYAELLLELDDGRKTAVLVFPGVCSDDAFRRLRKFLLRSKTVPVPDNAGFINRLGGKLMSILLRIKQRLNATRDVVE